jgi:hypothetical protein
MLRRFGMTLEEWQQLPSRSPKYRRGQRLMARYRFPVELLIGGFTLGSGFVMHFLGQDAAGISDLACIGSGGSAAYAQLMRRSQHAHMSLGRTLLHVAEAMREARIDQPDSVGEPADYVVITENQVRRMPAKDQNLQRMLQSYAGADTGEIDSDTALFNSLYAALYASGVSKEDYAKGTRTPRQD